MSDRLSSRSVLSWAFCMACQPAAAQAHPATSTYARIDEQPHLALLDSGSSSRTGVPREPSWHAIEREPDPDLLSRAPFGPVDAGIALGPVDPKTRWVFYCQETKSSSHDRPLPSSNLLVLRQKVDAMTPYLVRPPSSPLRVSAFLAASDDGRYLVLLSEAREPLLYDSEEDSSTTLADQELDMRADGLRGSLRSIAFSPDGSRIAMLTRGKKPRITLRELPSGGQTTITPVSDHVWRISFDGTGKFVVLHEVVEDTNRNGRLDWPIPERVLRNTQCSATVGALDAWIPAGDTAVTTIAPIEGGKAIRVDGFVAMLGSKAVVKTPGGPLAAVESGRTRRIGVTDCDARVIAPAARFGQILTSCADKTGRVVLELSSPSGSRVYEYDGPWSFADRTEPEANRFRALYAGVRTYLVDFGLAQVTMMQDRDQLLAQGTAGLIVRRANQVILVPPSSRGQPEVLLDGVRTGTRVQLGPGHVLVGDELLSASQGRTLGRVEYPVLSVSSNGCALVALGARLDGDPLARGPLQWVCPGS